MYPWKLAKNLGFQSKLIRLEKCYIVQTWLYGERWNWCNMSESSTTPTSSLLCRINLYCLRTHSPSDITFIVMLRPSQIYSMNRSTDQEHDCYPHHILSKVFPKFYSWHFTLGFSLFSPRLLYPRFFTLFSQAILPLYFNSFSLGCFNRRVLLV